MKNEKTLETIGARIKAAREERGLSQIELARELGFQSATAVSLIESDERKVTTVLLERLGDILRRDIKYFLGQEENRIVDVQVALRADKDLTNEDKDAISRFIELAKQKRNGK